MMEFAGNKTLDQQAGGTPQMSAAFAGWFKNITLVVITQLIIDRLVQNFETTVTFQGTIQPLTDRAIALKPEGDRAFTWLQIHCLAGTLNLNTNDRIIYNGKKYKIMANKDYSLYNYIEYHAVEDFQKQGC